MLTKAIEGVNTSTAIGKLLIVLSGIAEARKRGVYKGRPKKYTQKHSGLNHVIYKEGCK
ncbi:MULTISPECIES: hypothetical protein [Paenibacillus]|uniref:hypothetical protein n=1 Tax=Paenibacillus TaxID=44249 RepID=UPI001354F4ED|nr:MULTISPECIES: hypothetical protein [Paenibacillus]MDY8025811.1 hypothetical protein [Paenibacillus polymyxa]MXO77697.1 hypothetical protein [Paenibacillus sp. OT2-17]